MSAIGKIALTILLILGIVAAALWILGGKQSEYSTALSIDAPPEAIFPYLTKPERLKSWTSGLNEVAEFFPTPKINGIASGRPKKSQRVMSTNGSPVSFEDQVIRYEENQSISVQSINSQQVVTYIYQLEPRDGQTFLSYRIKKASCGVGRFLAPLWSSNDQDRIDADIRKLKDLVEKTPYPKVNSNNAELNQSRFSSTQPTGSTQSSIPASAPAAPVSEEPGQRNLEIAAPVSNETNQRNAETPVSGQPFSF